MLFTYPVAGAPDMVIALFVGMVLFVVNEANRVENQVIMQVVFYRREVVKTNSYLPPNTAPASSMPILCASSGVVSPTAKDCIKCRPKMCAAISGSFPRPCKLNIGGFQPAAERGRKQLPVCLFGI